ncbi:MAG TPA: hypothetical protein DCR40_01450 [Prolixibacteraceae bacterium]|nr:hypothetical protein [Prolixibacteraceae bacterium]
MNTIINTLGSFNKLTLSDLDRVKLMNRIDRKYCLHISKLPGILDAVKTGYSLLEIQDETIFKYDNTYFDTPDNQMYISHQNGKRNRFKIRLRKYVLTTDHFLEVKFKNNKGRTMKERVERLDFIPVFAPNELSFISQSSTYSGLQLEPKISSYFNRFTLVDNEFTERVTIDIFPGFKNHEKEIILNSLVIIEVKQSKTARPALITKILKENKISSQGFSKYCIGRSLLEDQIKKNNFKPLLLKIRKEYNN